MKYFERPSGFYRKHRNLGETAEQPGVGSAITTFLDAFTRLLIAGSEVKIDTKDNPQETLDSGLGLDSDAKK